MSIDRPIINIVMPPDFKVVSKNALELCELFLDGLISSKSQKCILRIDIGNRHVECCHEKLKKIIDLLVGSGKFDEFKQQLFSLLHSVDGNGAIGELRYLHAGAIKSFIFLNASNHGRSDIAWEVVSK